MFANNTDKYLESETMLRLAPGNHELDSLLYIASVKNFSMIAHVARPFIPISSVSCTYTGKFEFNHVNSVEINGIKFIGCGDSKIQFVNHSRLESSYFLGQEESGTTLELVKTSITIMKCSFINSTNGSKCDNVPAFLPDQSNFSFCGGALQIIYSISMISDSVFFGNHATIGGAIYSSFSITWMANNFFMNNVAQNSGGAIFSSSSETWILNSYFENNGALNVGGAMFALDQSLVSINTSIFKDNHADIGGALAGWNYSVLAITESEFVNNTAHNGGVISIFFCTLDIKGSQFSYNQVRRTRAIDPDGPAPDGNGGVIYAASESNTTILNSSFSMNYAEIGGGAVISAEYCTLDIRQGLFINNSSPIGIGGAVEVDDESVMSAENSLFIANTAIQGGTIYAEESNLFFTNVTISHSLGSQCVLYLMDGYIAFNDYNTLSDNFGSLCGQTSTMHFIGHTSIIRCSAIKSEISEGGALTVFQSIVSIEGSVIMSNNSASKGGAMNLVESRVLMNGKNLSINYNTAEDRGGGIYMYESSIDGRNASTLTLKGNIGRVRGGGIHAIGSTINIYDDNENTKLYLFENSAREGGGICFEDNSKFYLIKPGFQTPNHSAMAHFIGNSADYGGALRVVDDSYFSICESESVNRIDYEVECFFQVLTDIPMEGGYYNPLSIHFEKNCANCSGDDLYGGLLDRCTLNPSAEIVQRSTVYNVSFAKDSVSYLSNVSNIDKNLSTISSSPVRICFCEDDQPDCSYQPPIKEIMKGELFHCSLVAVDQINHTVNDVTIRSSLKFKESGLGEGQLAQKIGSTCTNLTISISSPHTFEELMAYAEGPCKDAKLSLSIIKIRFRNCSCPIGLQQIESEQTHCVCECSNELRDCITNCNQQNGTIVRDSTCWFNSLSDNISDYYEYLIYRYCPYDYCISPQSRVEINLNIEDGADAQCANNRSGLLCGSCKPGLSLSLGSSHCLKCPSNWPELLVAYVLTTLLGGIVLVAFLLWLKLTVAVGTLNGILLYANIVATNTTFLPFKSTNFISVFVSILNLELGINMCLYEGMDSYWKTWIETVFSAYVILLVIIVIILSEHFTLFSRLIGKKNPVATLATLILLSYTKLLRTVITSFSFAVLDYPDGSHGLVWLPDASVKFLQGKHIALFIMASLILLVGVVYTTLLFSWQWLLHHQDKRIFHWVGNQKLYLFLEPYHAPYTFKHRYWTGLLLLIRVGLYIFISMVNRSNDPAVNHLATGMVMIGLLLAKSLLGNSQCIYKKWPVEVLEMMSYFNIALYSVTKLYLLETNSNSEDILGYISGTFTFILFLLVFVYHIFTEVLCKVRIFNVCRRCGGPQ